MYRSWWWIHPSDPAALALCGCRCPIATNGWQTNGAACAPKRASQSRLQTLLFLKHVATALQTNGVAALRRCADQQTVSVTEIATSSLVSTDGMRLVCCGRPMLWSHGQKRFHIGHAHHARVAHATGLHCTPSDKKSNPIKVGLLGFEAIVLIPYPLAHLVKQAGELQGRGTGFHGKFILV